MTPLDRKDTEIAAELLAQTAGKQARATKIHRNELHPCCCWPFFHGFSFH
jgi:hypothetical protein